MKINITTDGGKRILLWFPTRLILNRLTAHLIVKHINKENKKSGESKLTSRQFMPLVKEIHRQRRRRDEKWVLVDVESASGEKVRIIL
jgi:hypothetical protein